MKVREAPYEAVQLAKSAKSKLEKVRVGLLSGDALSGACKVECGKGCAKPKRLKYKIW